MKIGRILPPEMAALQEEIEGYARGYGLDFFPQIFEVLDYDQINQVAAYGGFPIRYPHWRFGMDYERLSKGYEYGLQKIYEMVINNNPCYAYLLESNSYVDQKIVMAHVYAHNDFFKNNEYFKHTNRRMIDEMANHAIRVRRYMDRYGIEEVETFIDICLSLDNLIDYYSAYFEDMKLEDDEDEPIQAQETPKFRVEKEYMQDYINPEWFLEEQRRKMQKEKDARRRFPRRAVKDVLWFLRNYAPLTNWQRDVLGMIREEAYYFAPQGQTKILNEGWACLRADSLVYTEKGLITMAEMVEGSAGWVFDGEAPRKVYDRHILKQHPTVEIHTRRGLVLCGSNNHRVLLADGETWKRLDALVVGDKVKLSGGQGFGPREEQAMGTTNAQALIEGISDFGLLRTVPQALLRAPMAVVRLFLRALFESQSAVGPQGIRLRASSERLAQQVQLLLMNDSILSTRGIHDGSATLTISSHSAKQFAERIGFLQPRHRAALEAYLLETPIATQEEWVDEVVVIKTGCEDVYDISVTQTHRYAAQGLINHNSYWHSTIMTQKAAKDSEIVDFAIAHSGVVATSREQLNPYKLGLELLRDIEDRWNKGRFGKEYDLCDDMRARSSWDRKLGLGREKIFQVRKIYNDVNFIDEFLTREFCEQHNLFGFDYNRSTGRYEISSRDFKQIKEKLLFQLTNFGQPFIYILDANFENRAELLLGHRHEGVDLRLDYAKAVLENIHKLWKRPTHVSTRMDNKGRLLSFDGKEHHVREFEYVPFKG